jgi:hypothetical protein
VSGFCQGAASLLGAVSSGIVCAVSYAHAVRCWADSHMTFEQYWARDFGWYDSSAAALDVGQIRQFAAANFSGMQEQQLSQSYGFAAVAGLAALFGGYYLWRTFSAASARRRLQYFWQRQFDRGFLPLLFDEQVAALLRKLHREKLPGVAELKPDPQSLGQRLTQSAVHAEGLALARGYVEGLRRSDLRLVVPFGGTIPWGLLLAVIAVWALVSTVMICTGRLLGQRGLPDCSFVLAALALQAGPLAALEFSRLSSRVSTALTELLRELLD